MKWNPLASWAASRRRRQTRRSGSRSVCRSWQTIVMSTSSGSASSPAPCSRGVDKPRPGVCMDGVEGTTLTLMGARCVPLRLSEAEATARPSNLSGCCVDPAAASAGLVLALATYRASVPGLTNVRASFFLFLCARGVGPGRCATWFVAFAFACAPFLFRLLWFAETPPIALL